MNATLHHLPACGLPLTQLLNLCPVRPALHQQTAVSSRQLHRQSTACNRGPTSSVQANVLCVGLDTMLCDGAWRPPQVSPRSGVIFCSGPDCHACSVANFLPIFTNIVNVLKIDFPISRRVFRENQDRLFSYFIKKCTTVQQFQRTVVQLTFAQNVGFQITFVRKLQLTVVRHSN